MPENFWIIYYNNLTGEHAKMQWLEWLAFKYCAKEDIHPECDQVGIYNTIEQADEALIKILNK